MQKNLDISQVPDTSRLYRDYLMQTDAIVRFYDYQFSDMDSLFLRDESFIEPCCPGLITVLEKQNRAFGAGDITLRNIRKLEKGGRAIVTGQQLGVAGGPLYTIYKALTACKLADHLTEVYDVPCVPVFWLEAFDHDFVEASQIFIPDMQNKILRLEVGRDDEKKKIVSKRQLGDSIQHLIETFVENSPITDFLPEILSLLKNSYHPDHNFVDAFGKFLTYLTAEYGLVLFNPIDEQAAPFFIPVFQKAVTQSNDIDQALLEKNDALIHEGYHHQIQPQSTHSLHLFYEWNEERHRILIENDHTFRITDELTFTEEALLTEIAENPQRFSTDVALRPILQDLVLPTIVYVAGPSEIAYFAQLGGAYDIFGRTMPLIYPRASFTILERKIKKVLDKYDLTIVDAFLDSEELFQRLIGEFDIDLTPVFAQVHANVRNELHQLSKLLESIDPNLKSATKNAMDKINYQIEKLESRSLSAQQKNNDVLIQQIKKFKIILYPNNRLQERVFNILYYLVRYGMVFIDDVYNTIENKPVPHSILEI